MVDLWITVWMGSIVTVATPMWPSAEAGTMSSDTFDGWVSLMVTAGGPALACLAWAVVGRWIRRPTPSPTGRWWALLVLLWIAIWSGTTGATGLALARWLPGGTADKNFTGTVVFVALCCGPVLASLAGIAVARRTPARTTP